MIKRIYLEITNKCNLDCPFCTNSKGNDFMPIEKVKDYLKQIKEITDYVYLHVLGEPLLHKDIEEILNYTDSINLNVQLVTNGTLLNKHKDILLHPSLRKLSISIHSINNINNNDYFKTINEIIENNNNKYIELRFYDLNNLNTKIKEYYDYLINKYKPTETKRNNSLKLIDNVYIYEEEIFKWPNINDSFISNQGTCKGAIDQLAILNDGRVTICCLDSYGHNTIGNLNNTTLKEIIESNKYKDIVNNLKNNKLDFDLCKKCTYRLRF